MLQCCVLMLQQGYISGKRKAPGERFPSISVQVCMILGPQPG